ncbi:uncharacterized protein [Antedon mediterranea]|uniref:uncharacterized protein n=1 Tax=Antedon mediterranea TaxID=105859 RepID=UPI003AF74180
MVSIYLTAPNPTDFLPDAVYHMLIVEFLHLSKIKERKSDDIQLFQNRSDFGFDNHVVSFGAVEHEDRNGERETQVNALKFQIARRVEIDNDDIGTVRMVDSPRSAFCKEILDYLQDHLATKCKVGYKLSVLCIACKPSKPHFHDLQRCLDNPTVPCERNSMITQGFQRLFLTDPKRPTIPKKPTLIKSATGQQVGTLRRESREKKFQQMLMQVSKWFEEHISLDMLKTLCKDKIKCLSDLQKAETPKELFEFMKNDGHLTAINFKIIIEIIDVTGKTGVLEVNKLLKDTYEKADHQIKSFTRYRQKLIDFGTRLGDDNIATLIQLENVSKKHRNNQWTVILDLEQRGILNEHYLQPFIDNLKDNELTSMAKILEEATQC